MNLNTFFLVAGPTTLASLISDLENALPNVPGHSTLLAEELLKTARKELIAICGEEEAERLIYQHQD